MKLPNVFANTDIRTVDNNDSSCIACNGIDKSLLRSYFDNDGYVNKLNVIIRTKDGYSSERLILYRDNYVVNIDNKKIYLDDIIDFQLKK